ncbi:MAG: HAD family hydrolase [Leptothrix ochracea]|uniref:HAD family hydrolase n=1 Tax=Leptothrix ochracea TaxID=735331 RepID=UPI0034E29B16
MNDRPRPFDLIVFDWDGTLCDSTALIVRCIQAACRDLGVPEPTDRAAAQVIGLSLGNALREAVPSLDDARYTQLVERYRHHYFGNNHGVALFDGVLDMLATLRARHHWLAVATGKSRRGLSEALQACGLNAVFDATRTAEETASKPHPMMLLELMREFGADPERTLMIGDTSHDLLLAANAGVAAVAVSYGAHDAASLAALNPRHLAHDVADLHQWLRENT